MVPLYIHVGFAKTGTTWLQSRVFSKNPHINYRPSRGHITNLLIPTHPLSDIVEKVNLIREQASSPLLFSHESLVGHFFAPEQDRPDILDTADVAKRIHEAFPDARIIMTIREQGDMIESMYRHYIFGGGSKDPARAIKDDLLVDPYLHYHNAINSYEGLFGVENTWVGLFETLNDAPKLFLESLWSFMNVTPLKLDAEIFTKRDNVGLSSKMMTDIRLYNRSIRKLTLQNPSLIGFAHRNFKRMDKVLGGRSEHTPWATKGAFDLNGFAEGNRLLNESRQLNMEKYGYSL